MFFSMPLQDILFGVNNLGSPIFKSSIFEVRIIQFAFTFGLI